MKLSLQKKHCNCIMAPTASPAGALVNALALAKLAEHDDPIIRQRAAEIIGRDCPMHPRGRPS